MVGVLNATCPVCNVTLPLNELALVRSSECGHGVCCTCIGSNYPVKVSHTGTIIWPTSFKTVKCLVCKHESSIDNLSSWFSELSLYDKHCIAKRRILAAMNCDRECFDTDEQYDEFMEDRDELIYTLVHEQDADVLRETEYKISQNTIRYQAKALETCEREKKRNIANAINVATEEGNFYELIKQPYSHGFKLQEAGIYHRLVVGDTTLLGNTNTTLLHDSDLSHGIAPLSADALLSQLRSAIPAMLNHTRIRGNTRQRAEAGGFSKHKVLQRTRLEMYSYFVNAR